MSKLATVYTVYVLHFPDLTHYTGITTDLTRRLREHSSKENGYVGRKLRGLQAIGRFIPDYEVTFTVQTLNKSDERYYKQRVHQVCQKCKSAVSVNSLKK